MRTQTRARAHTDTLTHTHTHTHRAHARQALVLGGGDAVAAVADNGNGVKFLLIAGEPLKEPIVVEGPFVMNTKEEIQQAILDWKKGGSVCD